MPTCICDSLTDGILKGCTNNAGSITGLWFTEKCNVASTSVSSPGGYIEPVLNALAKFWKFEFNKKTSTYTEDFTGDEAIGSEAYAQTITLKLTGRDKTKRAILLLMAHFKELVAIVKDGNGLYWYLGEVDGIVMKENKSENGLGKLDFNGYNLSFVGEEANPAMEISSTYIATLVAAGDINTL